MSCYLPSLDIFALVNTRISKASASPGSGGLAASLGLQPEKGSGNKRWGFWCVNSREERAMKWRNEVKYQLHCADYSFIYPPGAVTLQIQGSSREVWV